MPYQNSLKRAFHTGVLIEEQRDQILSEETFEMHLQESRAEHADFHSHRMEDLPYKSGIWKPHDENKPGSKQY